MTVQRGVDPHLVCNIVDQGQNCHHIVPGCHSQYQTSILLVIMLHNHHQSSTHTKMEVCCVGVGGVLSNKQSNSNDNPLSPLNSSAAFSLMTAAPTLQTIQTVNFN